ncbi:MAG: hypothetical protein GY810_21635 [Aureispira sp.]|nr:hypothetical protein [Aureispira sp.]
MISIFLKELKTHLIDWRFWSRLFLAFFIPFYLFSRVWFFTGQVIQLQVGQTNSNYNVAAIGLDKESPLFKQLSLDSKLNWVDGIQANEIDSLILKDSLQLVIVFPQLFDSVLAKGQQAKLDVHYNSNQGGQAIDKIFNKLEAFEQKFINKKAQELGLNKSTVNPILIENHDSFDPMSLFSEIVDSVLTVIEQSLSSVLAILFWLALLFLTSYCSITTFALAKEFKSFERLLKSGVSMPSIVLGKTLWISLSGTLAVSLAFLGILWSLDSGQEGWILSITEHMQGLLHNGVVTKSIIWAMAMAWLVAALLGSINIRSSSTYKALKRTFYVQALVFIFVLAGMMLLPELGIGSAFLPIMNSVALFKGLIANTLSTLTFAVAVGIPFLLGVAIVHNTANRNLD